MKIWTVFGYWQTTGKLSWFDCFETLAGAKQATEDRIERGAGMGNDMGIRWLDHREMIRNDVPTIYVDKEGHDNYYYISETEVKP